MELRQRGAQGLRVTETSLKDVHVLRERHISLDKKKGTVHITSEMSPKEKLYWNGLSNEEKIALIRKVKDKDMQEAVQETVYDTSIMERPAQYQERVVAENSFMTVNDDLPGDGLQTIDVTHKNKITHPLKGTLSGTIQTSEPASSGINPVNKALDAKKTEDVSRLSQVKNIIRLNVKGGSGVTHTGKADIFSRSSAEEIHRYQRTSHLEKNMAVKDTKLFRSSSFSIQSFQPAVDGIPGTEAFPVQALRTRQRSIWVLPTERKIPGADQAAFNTDQCTLEQAGNLARLVRQRMLSDPAVKLTQNRMTVTDRGGSIYPLSGYTDPESLNVVTEAGIGKMSSSFSVVGKLLRRWKISGTDALNNNVSPVEYIRTGAGIGSRISTLASTGLKTVAAAMPKVVSGAIVAGCTAAFISAAAITAPFTTATLFRTLTGASIYNGQNQEWDYICYLASKYESSGNPDDCGGDNGWACGEIQFDVRHELLPFVKWCYQKDPVFFAPFSSYASWPDSRKYELRNNHTFYNAWHEIYAKDKIKFEYSQFEFVLTVSDKYPSWIKNLSRKYQWYDFANAPLAIRAAILAMGNRAPATMYYCFEGIAAGMSNEDIINHIYPRQLRSPYAHYGPTRMRCEHKDCLAMLRGTIDIYAKDGNAAGGIDWSYKRTFTGSSVVGAQVVAYCEEAVGSRYDRGNRMGDRVYDCSSLAFRAYNSAGIQYLNGMTAAGEAEYLDNHGMTFHDRNQLQPGDLIFRTSSVTNKTCHLKDGRTTLIGHVEIYIGNDMMIHASGGKKGVVKERARYSNLSIGELYGRPLPVTQ